MKNVLLLLPGAFSGHGGIEMFDRQLVRAFLELGMEQGFETRVLVLNDDPDDVDDRYVPRKARCPRGFRGRKMSFVAAALVRALADQPDLVVWGHLHFAPLAPWICRITPRSRHWFIAHGIEAWKPLESAVRRGLGHAHKVLAVSDYTRRELATNAGLPLEWIEVLPNALDEVFRAQYASFECPQTVSEAAEPVILTVARLDASERYKGVDAVIDALPRVLRQVPGLRYEVVGDGDDRGRLESLARERGVASHVLFRGRLGPADLASAYQRCTAYVMPSSHEGFGIVFLEAALFAKPSVGGRHGGTPEVIEDGVTGLLVAREDLEGLAAAIVEVVRGNGRGRRMGKAAQAALEESFTYQVFRRNLERVVAAESSVTAGKAGGSSPR